MASLSPSQSSHNIQMASLSPSSTILCLDGIFKPISEKSLHHQQGQISWYSSVQSSSTFKFRLAHKPIYTLRFKKIEQGQLSYPKIFLIYLQILFRIIDIAQLVRI